MNEDHKPKKIKNVREVIIESIECEPGIKGCTADPDTCPNSPDVCDKKLSMFGYFDDTITDSVEHVLSRSLDDLTKTFTASAKRWELIVYPAMFSFVVLAVYGFFLIFSLTKDISVVSTEMVNMSRNMTQMSADVHSMTLIMQDQSAHISEMNKNMRNMSMSMNQMRYDMSNMSSNVSRPMNFMNSFAPW